MKSSRKLHGLFVALSALILAGCSSNSNEQSATVDTAPKQDVTSTVTSQPAPTSNFDLAAYNGPNFDLPLAATGEQVKLTDYFGNGGPVAVNFWGTWCPPCRMEMPEFKKIYSEYHDKGVEIIGVALRDTPEKVNAYTQQENYDWPMVIGNIVTARDFGNINAVPTTIIYDSQGTEIRRYTGPLHYTLFKSYLDEALRHEENIKKSS